MSKAPDRCLYCDGTDPNCGFCEMGVPLDTQEDWDRTWGRAFAAASAGIEHGMTTKEVLDLHRRAGRVSS